MSLQIFPYILVYSIALLGHLWSKQCQSLHRIFRKNVKQTRHVGIFFRLTAQKSRFLQRKTTALYLKGKHNYIKWMHLHSQCISALPGRITYLILVDTENRWGWISPSIFLVYCSSSRQLNPKLKFQALPLLELWDWELAGVSGLSSKLTPPGCFQLQLLFFALVSSSRYLLSLLHFCHLPQFTVLLSFVSVLLLLLVAYVCSLTQVIVLTLRSHTCLAVFPTSSSLLH